MVGVWCLALYRPSEMKPLAPIMKLSVHGVAELVQRAVDPDFVLGADKAVMSSEGRGTILVDLVT